MMEGLEKMGKDVYTISKNKIGRVFDKRKHHRNAGREV